MDKKPQLIKLIKAVVSTIVVYIPYLLFCYCFESKLPSFIVVLISIFFISLILEHFYRKLSAIVVSSNEKCWGNWFAPRFLGRVMVIVIFSVLIKWLTGVVVLNLPSAKQEVVAIMSFIVFFISYFIIYISYTAFLAYGIEDEKLLSGITKGMAVVCDNILFFVLSAFVLFLASNIPIIGYTCVLLLFVITEFIKAHIYADYYGLINYDDDEYFNY